MSRSRLRPATAPHTNKLPEACPHCGSHSISRKGVRKKKLEIVQVWRCGSCKRNFTPGPAALRNKTYPIRLVLQALTLDNLGYSLNETARRLKSKSGRAVSPSTIANWIGAHKEHTTFRRLRAEATTLYRLSRRRRDLARRHQCARPEHGGDAVVLGHGRYLGGRRISAAKRARRKLCRGH
jgi:transposase-like protein